MRRMLLAVATSLAVLCAACSSGGESSSSSDRKPTRTTTTDAPGTTTTTRPADLAAVNVALTAVAPAAAPTAMAVRQGEPTLYVAEQVGRVLAIRDGLLPTPVIDLTALVRSGDEQGLLGLEFAVDGSKLYVHYSGANGETVVDEYSFTSAPEGGGTADPATRRQLLTVEQPQPNHNGGELAIGPDGALYLGLGDGGSADDEGSGHAAEGNGQSPSTLLGKIVRIDVASGAAETFALGLRNPWRFSFDRATGDLWIGDVGQNAWEEIDRVPFANARGANFGWPLLEGTHPFRVDSAPGTVLPVFEVSQASGACAVIGGYVYRGDKIPDLRGAYLFTDNCDGRLRALRLDASGAVALERDLGVSVSGPTTFGEGNDGELYVLSGSEGVFRIDPA